MADNSGRFSKFQERIRNIRLSRSKKMRFQKENERFIQDKVTEIKEKVRADGGVYRVRVVRGIGEVKKKEEVKELQKNDASEEKAEALAAVLEEKYPDCEVEVNNGGQPIYYYIISVE